MSSSPVSGRSSRPVQSHIVGDHRSLGDAPTIGPVARMEPGTCPHRRRRVHHGGRLRMVRNRRIPRWLVVLLGIACIAFIAVLLRGTG